METKVIRLLPDGDPANGMEPSLFTDPDAFTTDDHSELNHTYFKTPDEKILSGVWQCAPCKEEISAYPVHEMMTVISGEVIITNADGSAETFSAGDVFFIAKGTKCTWEITKTLKKYYMIVE